jgi:MinD-like ATPase involved in chromosome partitioning or flagellar assembly
VTVIALGSVKASPGATTLALALALAWPRRADGGVRIVEADPDGGVLAARLGMRADPNLASLAVAGRRGLEEALVVEHEQVLADGVSLLAAPASGEQVIASLSSVGTDLVGLLEVSTVDAIVDVGRLSPRSPAFELARRASLILLVAAPKRDEVEAVAARAASIRDAGGALGLVCNRVRSTTAAVEFAEVAGVDLIGVIGEDGRAAASLTGDAPLSNRVLGRSNLLRQATDLACSVVERLSDGPTGVLARRTA